VPHRDIGVVPTSPAGIVQSPHEVDVFAEPQPLVEAADLVECIDAYHHSRSGHVADASAGANARRLGTQIER